ncbi:ABC transporter substrate-binding protein [Candidatus Kaiserbacteria bacterium]|nr:ABC transporter substrate-binding protein [Candidatus Kaiserbacteria bacterium]
MNRHWLLGIVVVCIVALAGTIYLFSTNKGADPGKMYRVGILVRGSGYDPAVEGFKKRMDELGYHEGKNITYDVQLISDKNQLVSAATKFVKDGVDLIHTYSTPATEAAANAVKNSPRLIPIVFGSVGDPLLIPGVRSISRPGGTVTGVASLSTDLTAQRLQLLKEFDPKIKRVAMPHTALDAGDLAANKSVEIAQATARELGIELTFFPVKTKDDNTITAAQILGKDFDGMIVGGDSLVWGSIDTYIQRAIREKIPFSVFSRSQVESGALFGLGPDYAVSGRQSADIANRILRGGNAGDIAVQIPEKLILVVNKDTAKAMDIVISETFLKNADIIIEKETQ